MPTLTTMIAGRYQLTIQEQLTLPTPPITTNDRRMLNQDSIGQSILCNYYIFFRLSSIKVLQPGYFNR